MTAPASKGVYVLVLTIAALGTSGCERVTRDMAQQPRYNPGSTSPLFDDLQASRRPPAGSVAYAAGDAASVSSGRRGRTSQEAAELPMSADTLSRGRERYDIYCAACHGLTGDGGGEVVRRGFPKPASFSTAGVSDRNRMVSVIEQGVGRMNGFGDRVKTPDAWAIADYLQALALSQSVPVNLLPPATQQELATSESSGGAR